MNYKRLKLNLEKYGRDHNYAYVSDSFNPQLRSDNKYRQWKKLLEKSSTKSFTFLERKTINALIDHKVKYIKYFNNID